MRVGVVLCVKIENAINTKPLLCISELCRKLVLSVRERFAIYTDHVIMFINKFKNTMRDRVRSGYHATKTYAEGLHFVTKWILLLLVCVHLVVNGSALPVFSLCFSLSALEFFEMYRIVTAVFVHLSALHLLMNTAALVSMGNKVETVLGSARFALTVLSAIVLNILMHVVVEFVFVKIFRFSAACHAGFSGVLFSIYVLDLADSGPAHRLGCFVFPTVMAPFVTLALVQVVFHASFTGHLSGILVGHVLKLGLPTRLEDLGYGITENLGHFPGFVPPSPRAAPPAVAEEGSFFEFFDGNHQPGEDQAREAEGENRVGLRENLRLLTEMGFDRRAALRALVLTGDLDGAVSMLSEAQNAV